MLFDWELWLVGNGAFFLTPNFQGMMNGWMDGWMNDDHGSSVLKGILGGYFCLCVSFDEIIMSIAIF